MSTLDEHFPTCLCVRSGDRTVLCLVHSGLSRDRQVLSLSLAVEEALTRIEALETAVLALTDLSRDHPNPGVFLDDDAEASA
ncbi:MAG: hypothetical protein AB1679_12195 [Actinomycetota bacterium]